MSTAIVYTSPGSLELEFITWYHPLKRYSPAREHKIQLEI